MDKFEIQLLIEIKKAMVPFTSQNHVEYISMLYIWKMFHFFIDYLNVTQVKKTGGNFNDFKLGWLEIETIR